MKQIIKFMKTIFLVVMVSSSCGAPGDSVVPDDDTYMDKTSSEEIWKKKLRDGEYDDAITLLLEEIDANPDEDIYVSYLGAAYLARAGIVVIDIIKNAGSGGISNDAVAAFVPSSPTDLQKSDIDAAVVRFLAVPEAVREGTELTTYGESTNFLLGVAAIVQSQFLLQDLENAAGNFDQTKLDNMTEAEAVAIIDSLRTASGALGTNVPPDLSQKLDQFDNASGSTTQEKLSSILAGS